MIDPLSAFQHAFAADLLCDDGAGSGSALARQPGFAVYRNTVLSGCIDALVANHPTVQQLVGDDWMRGAARLHVQQHPPSNDALGRFGGGFAAFLESFEPARDLPYLPGVAGLDFGWVQVHLAPDAPLLLPAKLAALDAAALAGALLVPHPAARWLSFASVPAYTIWRRHREHVPLGAELDWHGESALLTRPTGAVQWTAIPACAAAFLDGCSAGAAFADALDHAMRVPEAVAPDEWLLSLVEAGAFTRVVFEPEPTQ